MQPNSMQPNTLHPINVNNASFENPINKNIDVNLANLEKLDIQNSSNENEKKVEVFVEKPVVMEDNLNKMNIQNKDSSSTIFQKEPPYGCIKNGPKPTYRQWKNKTQKKTNIHLDDFPDESQQSFDNVDGYKILKRKTTKSKYKVGKKNKKIGVFIKNNSTRKRIQKEHTELKKKPISEIKQYLFDKNLLKIGSTAPNDVLRSLYEQSILAGNIKNNTEGVVLHNFLEEN